MIAGREVVLAFRRTPLLSILSILTIAVSLFAFGLYGLVAMNISAALEQVESRVELRAFLAQGTPPETVSGMLQDILAFPEVATATYVSQTEALAQARRDLKEFSDVFEAGILPATIEIKLRAGSRDPTTVAHVAERVKSYTSVEDIQYGEEWVQKLYDIRNAVSLVGSVLGVAFAAVAVIIIGATIRMGVLARSREISIMRFVGATDGFIRRPFLLEGAAKGVLGGIAALLLVWLAGYAVDRHVMKIEFFTPSLAAGGILAGALIGFLGSAVSVGRHLRKV